MGPIAILRENSLEALTQSSGKLRHGRCHGKRAKVTAFVTIVGLAREGASIAIGIVDGLPYQFRTDISLLSRQQVSQNNQAVNIHDRQGFTDAITRKLPFFI